MSLFMVVVYLSMLTSCSCETKLIPRNEFLRKSDYQNVQLSPDGRYVAYKAPAFEQNLNGTVNIFVQVLPNGKPKLLTHETVEGISSIEFAANSKHIIYSSDEDGDENYSLKSVDINTGKITVIEDDPKVRSYVLKTSPKRPNEVVIAVNKRNPIFHDAFIAHLETGEKKLLFENNYFLALTFNFDLKPIIGKNQTDIAQTNYYHILPDGSSKLLRSSPALSRYSTKLLRVDDADMIYWLDADSTDKSELVATDLSFHQKKVLYSPKKADISEVIFNPLTGCPLWAYENYMKVEPVQIDSTFASDFKCLKRNLPSNATIHVSAVSNDLSKWLVESQDNKPSSYYIFDRSQRTIYFLFSSYQKVASYPLAWTYPKEVRTSDGLTEVCYITVPVDYDLQKNGIPSQPMPTVLFVHGGPQWRDFWEYEVNTKFLANRNYVVIQCNYRGSTGYGKAFINAGNGEWGKKMQQDLTDAVKWAIEQKIADPAKVAIMGGSFGGYATLCGLAFTPDLYACGVDIFGMSNLITMHQAIPEYWKPQRFAFELDMGGNLETEQGREHLRQSSPLFWADKMKKPLLIGHGANDPRVKKEESDQLVDVLKNQSIPVTYVVFSNEGHGFNHPENIIAFMSIAEKFLGQCLGGRVEPATDEIQKSTGKVQTYPAT